MKMPNRLELMVAAAAVLLSPMGLSYAEQKGKPTQEEQMQQMMEMIKGMSQGAGQGKGKGEGMDEKTQRQLENMFKGMGQKMDERQADKLKKEQETFAAETKGHGAATVEVKGKRYDLTMITCEITDRNSGQFQMKARQAPGKENVTLNIGSGGGHSRNQIYLSLGKNDPYEEVGTPTFQLKGKALAWEGQVGMGSNKQVPLKFHMTCGGEMKDYAVASKPKPKSAANVLTFQLGNETHTFHAGHCLTKEYRTGNLMVQFEATATGKFRGRPAILLTSKSHPFESQQTFQNMDLLLGELTPEERMLSPLEVAELLRKKIGDFANRKNAAIKKKYDPKIAAYQEKFDREMPALKKKYGKQIPQDKMKALMEPFNKLTDAQMKESSQVSKQVKAMRYPSARSNGPFTVTGQAVHYGGSPLRTQDAQRAKEFRNLNADPELWVTCGKQPS